MPRFSWAGSPVPWKAKLDHNATRSPLPIEDHAVDVVRPVDEIEGLQVGFAKPDRPRQRVLHGLDGGDLGGPVDQLEIRAQADRPERRRPGCGSFVLSRAARTGVSPISLGS